MKNFKKTWKKLWHFIWEDDGAWSWLINIVLAFVLIKFIVYPGLGFILATTHPVVAVVSESMEHADDFDGWWENAGSWYANANITKNDFGRFPLNGGFNKGDIMVLRGKKPQEIKTGDIIVFWSAKKDPIIHRVVNRWKYNDTYYFQTKGDNYRTNPSSIKNSFLDETRINQDQVVGNAFLRIPLLGYVKILFNDWVWEPMLKPLIGLV